MSLAMKLTVLKEIDDQGFLLMSNAKLPATALDRK